MSKVQNHLTDAKKIAAYNQKKEQKMRVRWGLGSFAAWGSGVHGCRARLCRATGQKFAGAGMERASSPLC